MGQAHVCRGVCRPQHDNGHVHGNDTHWCRRGIAVVNRTAGGSGARVCRGAVDWAILGSYRTERVKHFPESAEFPPL